MFVAAGYLLLPRALGLAMTSIERPADEAANFITHGLGLIISLPAAAYLMHTAVGNGDARVIVSCGIYCLALVTLYSASTLSHAFYDINYRRLFRTIDQASIFFMIAGSFTPFAVGFLGEGHWWVLLAAMWALALTGGFHVLVKRDLSRREKFAYGALGWLPIISLIEMSRNGSQEIILLIVAGGLFYSFGSIFLALGKRIRYLHALWHLFVLAGTTCHYFGILSYASLR